MLSLNLKKDHLTAFFGTLAFTIKFLAPFRSFMNVRQPALTALAVLASLSLGLTAKADTTDARCDVYPKGSDQVTSTGACSFSQRQGYVTITLEDGTTYELTPSPTQAATYTDQDGQPASREDALGTFGVIYRLADVSIFVYWDATTISSEPRRGEGNVPCSAERPSFDQMCQASAIYGDPGNATLTLIGPTGNEHNLSYYGNTLHSPDPNEMLQVQYLNGEYLVAIDDNEFFRLDEIIVTGVD